MTAGATIGGNISVIGSPGNLIAKETIEKFSEGAMAVMSSLKSQFFMMIVFWIGHQARESRVSGIVLSALDFKRHDMTVALHHKVYLAMLWGIVVLGLESVRDELLGDEVFEDGSEVDVRFAVEQLELDAVHVLGGQETDVVHEQHRQDRESRITPRHGS